MIHAHRYIKYAELCHMMRACFKRALLCRVQNIPLTPNAIVVEEQKMSCIVRKICYKLSVPLILFVTVSSSSAVRHQRPARGRRDTSLSSGKPFYDLTLSFFLSERFGKTLRVYSVHCAEDTRMRPSFFFRSPLATFICI